MWLRITRAKARSGPRNTSERRRNQSNVPSIIWNLIGWLQGRRATVSGSGNMGSAHDGAGIWTYDSHDILVGHWSIFRSVRIDDYTQRLHEGLGGWSSAFLRYGYWRFRVGVTPYLLGLVIAMTIQPLYYLSAMNKIFWVGIYLLFSSGVWLPSSEGCLVRSLLIKWINLQKY